MASLWGELKRRNVVKVAVAYAIVAWLLVQIAATVLPIFDAPRWTIQVFTLFLILGFPIALILSWAYELTPRGIERTRAVPLSESVGRVTRRKLELAIIGVLAIAVGYFAIDQFVLKSTSGAGTVNSVAVLPFRNLSPDEDDAFFAAGLHEAVLAQLRKLSGLRVISRTSVLRYADSDISIPEIGRELDVATVMEASVRYADERVRITATLIDAETDESRWNDEYDETFENLFELESAVALEVANALATEFSLDERESIESSPTDSNEAYRLYWRGRDFWNRRNAQDIQDAIRYFERATQLDDNYALAYSGIADAWIFRGWYSVRPPAEAYMKAEEAATKALSIDEDLAEAHASLGNIHMEFYRDWRAAEREFEEAIRLNPRYAVAHHWYGGYLSARERHEEALRQAIEARALEPSHIINTWVGLRHYFAGRYSAAIEEYQEVLALDEEFAPAHWHLGWAYAQTGEFDDAISHARRAYEITDNPIYLASLGHAHAIAGDSRRAREVLDELERIAAGSRHVSAYHVAVVYGALGDLDEGFRRLDDAYAERSPWIGYLKVDPRLEPLRSDPRFDALLRQAGMD